MKTKIMILLSIIIFSFSSTYAQKTSEDLTRGGTEGNANDTTTSEAGGNTCSEAAAFCTEGTYNFLAKEGLDAETGPDYGCLTTQHNPTWYYMRTKTAGDIVMALSSNQDLDFIIWGPFNSTTCDYANLDDAHIIDCSNANYIDGVDETPEISNANPGDYYMFMITMNVIDSNSSRKFQLKQTSGSGETDCSILCPLYENLSVNLTDCYPISKTESKYNLTGSVSFETDYIDRIIVEWDNDTIADSLTNFVSPFTFKKDSLNSDNISHSIMVTCEYHDMNGNPFSCEKVINYTAPEDCSGECIVNAGPDITVCGDSLIMNAHIKPSDKKHYWTIPVNLSIPSNSDTTASVYYTGNYPTGHSVVIPLVWTIKNRVDRICSDTTLVTFKPIPSSKFNLSDAVCGPEPAKSICQESLVSIAEYQWTYDNGEELTKIPNDSILVSFKTEGKKEICLSVKSIENCQSDTLCDTVNVKHIPSASFSISEENLFCNSDANDDISESIITINDNTDLKDAIFKWRWDSNFKILDSTKSPIEFIITSNKVGYRNISLYIIKDGCSSELYEDSIKICSKIKVANIFTPNGDNKNDVFYVKAKGMSTYHCTIYDRWGKIVFKSSDSDDHWNGKIMNTGSELSSGTYFYVIEAKDADNNQYLRKGHLQLLRNN